MGKVSAAVCFCDVVLMVRVRDGVDGGEDRGGVFRCVARGAGEQVRVQVS